MFARAILEYLRNILFQYGEEKADRWLRENMDTGPTALHYVQIDVDELASLVYEYQARMMVAQEALSLPRMTNADYITACTHRPRYSELSDLNDLIAEIEKHITRSSDLRSAVRARVRTNIERARNQLRQSREYMEAVETEGKNFHFITQAGQMVRRASAVLAQNQARLHQINQVGSSIQARFEEMLSVLEAVRSDLEQNHDGLIYFIKDCNAWRRDWNQWNYKQQGR